MANPLRKTAFTKDLLDRVQSFYSGDERYCKYVDNWIKGDEHTEFSALNSVRNTETFLQVWLYTCPNGGLVGYGSLHIKSYPWFSGWDFHGPAFEIPKVAVHKDYQGKQIEGKSYADYVLDDLVAHARDIRKVLLTVEPVIILWVDPENQRAKRFYEKHGFIKKDQTHEEDGIIYESMYLVFDD